MGVAPVSVPQNLKAALTSAGDKSGVDFDYLLQTAIRESSLNPKAKATTSSATGLFQFLDATWLEVMKEEGARLGYAEYADQITRTRSGDYVVADKAVRKDILKLREDPQIAADLAAAFTRRNGAYLFEAFGRMPSPGELYIAHFLGAQGAAEFFRAGLDNPDQNAAKLFPRQARANPTIFYELGEARTVRDVYRALVAKHVGLPEIKAPVIESLAEERTLVPPTVAPLALPPIGTATAYAPVEPLAAVAEPEPPASDAAFAAQQLAAAGTKWPGTEALPSRVGPTSADFTELFESPGEIPGRTLLTRRGEAAGAALFTQLYGQAGWGRR
jgi:hypothetical protein